MRAKPWTPAQADRRERARELGCICCWLNVDRGLFRATGMAVEIDHDNLGGIAGAPRKGHDFTTPKCAWHHRAICRPGFTSTHMLLAFGPSLAKGSKTFRALYGTDAELLALTNRLLGEKAA